MTTARTRGRAQVVALLALVLTGALCGCGASSSRSSTSGRSGTAAATGAASAPAEAGGPLADASFGPFAGYVWSGPARSVGASWTVPRILGGSRGFASTWIGAQVPRARTAFIQLGTNEEHQPRAGERAGAPIYTAFWSDTAMRFHPRALFAVRPGELISARLRQNRGRWELTIVDHSSGASAHLATRQEGATAMALAEWVQEDVTDNETGRPVAYPLLSAVGFQDLEVNSQPPAYAHVSSEWMSTGATALAPGPLRGDRFTLRLASMSSAGARYLGFAAARSDAAQTLLAAAARWTPASSYSEVAGAGGRFAAVLGASAKELTSGRWPARAQAPIRRLVAETEAAQSLARPPAIVSPAALRRWQKRLEAGLTRLELSSRAVRRALALPELTPRR